MVMRKADIHKIDIFNILKNNLVIVIAFIYFK